MRPGKTTYNTETAERAERTGVRHEPRVRNDQRRSRGRRSHPGPRTDRRRRHAVSELRLRRSSGTPGKRVARVRRSMRTIRMARAAGFREQPLDDFGEALEPHGLEVDGGAKRIELVGHVL